MCIYINLMLKMNDDIAEILLKVALNTMTLIHYPKNERSSNSPWLKKRVNRESVANCLFYCYSCLLHISLVLVISDLCSAPLFIWFSIWFEQLNLSFVSDGGYSRNTHDNINILPFVESVMVVYHTREKISHSGKRISPETKSRLIFFFQSVIFFPGCGHLP